MISVLHIVHELPADIASARYACTPEEAWAGFNDIALLEGMAGARGMLAGSAAEISKGYTASYAPTDLGGIRDITFTIDTFDDENRKRVDMLSVMADEEVARATIGYRIESTKNRKSAVVAALHELYVDKKLLAAALPPEQQDELRFLRGPMSLQRLALEKCVGFKIGRQLYRLGGSIRDQQPKSSRGKVA